MTFVGLVEVIVKETIGPESLWLLIFVRVVRYSPMIPGHNCALGESVAFKFVIRRQGVGKSRLSIGGSGHDR